MRHKKGPGRGKPGKNGLKSYSISKREDYQSYWGMQDRLRDTWQPKRSVQMRRWEPTAEDLFLGRKPGDDEEGS